MPRGVSSEYERPHLTGNIGNIGNTPRRVAAFGVTLWRDTPGVSNHNVTPKADLSERAHQQDQDCDDPSRPLPEIWSGPG